MKDTKVENMDDIFSKENLEFMCQFKIRPAVLKVLKENFNVETIMVISEKKELIKN